MAEPNGESGSPIHRHRFAIIAALIVFTAFMVRIYTSDGQLARDAQTGCRAYAGDRVHPMRNGDILPDVLFELTAANRVEFISRGKYWCEVEVTDGPNRGRRGWLLPGNGRR